MPDRAPLVRVYTRSDGKYGWTLYAANGRKIATDHGQGFRDKADAVRSFRRLEQILWTSDGLIEVDGG